MIRSDTKDKFNRLQKISDRLNLNFTIETIDWKPII